MFFAILCCEILCNRTKQCSPRKSIIELNPSNYDEIIGQGRPVFVRLENNGCPFAKTSEYYWRQASQLYPNIQFVRTECIRYASLCRQLGAFSSPSHALYGPNNQKMIAFFTNPVDISSSSKYYGDVIQQTLEMYSFDVPTIEEIIPQNAHLFFNSYKYPIFILYNSNCYEDVDFVSTWITKITDGDIDSEDFGYGKIDCSIYPEECMKWGTSFPAANVYSREKGISVSIKESDHLAKRLDTIVSFLNTSQDVLPTPVPYATPVPTPVPVIENVTKYTIDELESRTVDEIRAKYNSAKTKSYTGSDYSTSTGNIPDIMLCENVNIRQELVDDTVRFINFFRELVGLNAPITNRADKNADCALAAKYLTLKGSLSHSVDENYKTSCNFNQNDNWQKIKDTLRDSSLAQGFGHNDLLSCISGLMDDEGANNEGVVGHRRWFLYPYLKQVGVGYYPRSVHPIGNNKVLEYKPSGVFSIEFGPTFHVIPYPLINFIAYPPPGPFPTERLPSTWSIYYRGFQDTSVKLEHITLKLTRDDGIPLECSRIDFDNSNTYAAGMPGHLLWKFTDDSLSLITAGHSVHVQIYLLKDQTRDLLDYNVRFFDEQSQSSICFYNTDKSKCPSDVEESNKFGAGEYSNYKLTGFFRTIVNVVEDITIDDDNLTLDYSPEIIIKGNHINGKVVIPLDIKVDFGEPSNTNFVVSMNPNNFSTGLLVTARSPKSIHVNFTEYPSNRGDIRVLFYIGPYTSITYLSRAVNGEFRYYYSIKYDRQRTFLVSLVYTNVEYACQDGVNNYLDVLPKDTKCFSFHRFNDLRFLRTRKSLLRIYSDRILNVTGNGFPEGFYDVEIYGRNTYRFQIELEYSDRVNEKVRSLYIAKIGGQEINPYFKFPVKTYSAPMLYLETMTFPYRSIWINNYPAAFQNIVEGYSLTNVRGDWNAKKYLNKAFYVRFNESEKPFADANGNFKYTKSQDLTHQRDFPIIITNGLHNEYTLRWGYLAKENPTIIQTTDEAASKPIIFNVPGPDDNSNDVDHPKLFFKNYKDIVIKSERKIHSWTTSWDNVTYTETKNHFLYIRLINCSKVRFVDLTNPTKQVTELSTDIIGNVNVDISSNPLFPTQFDLVNFRTDKTVTCTNSILTEVIVYECTPTIKNARIFYTTVIDSNVKFINCTITGPVELRFCDGYNLPSIYLQNCTFNPSSIKVQIFSDAYLYGTDTAKILQKNEGLDLIISGLPPQQLSSLVSKFTFVNENNAATSSKKLVFSKDGKGLHLADSDYNINSAPETVPKQFDFENPDNYIEKEEVEEKEYNHEDEKDDNFHQDLVINPTPVPATPTPMATQEPTEVQPQQPSSQPQQPSSQPQQPSSQPQQPSSQPQQPSSQPQQPSSQPGKPSSQPQQPSSQPGKPSTQPQQPVSNVPEQSTQEDNGDSNNSETNSGKKSSNIGLIAGIVVGVFVAVAIAVGVAIFVVIRRHRSKHESSTGGAVGLPAGGDQNDDKNDKNDDEIEVENISNDQL